MMDTTEVMNPFRVWSELARGLLDRFVAELGNERSPYTGEMLGQLAGIITHSQHLGASLERLRQHDPKAYEAFLRALEGS